MHLENDYTSHDLPLKPDYEGEVKAVLIASKKNQGNRKSVLYLHGFVDYFFHPHVGERFHQHGFDFFALDLRKYGRSLMPHQHPNYCKDLREYFEEISLAIRTIKSEGNPLFLLAHSTGGLTASYYMNEGEERNHIDGLILNSPFLDFNQSPLSKFLSLLVVQIIGRLFTYAKVEGALPPAYAQSVHKDHYGAWDFNVKWKPIEGFPIYFKWVLAIAKAHQKMKQSAIDVPILLMHSSASKRMSKFSQEAMTHDIVLNVKDIQRVGEKLGNQVHRVEINRAQHDVFLSSEPVREEAFENMFSWLSTIA